MTHPIDTDKISQQDEHNFEAPAPAPAEQKSIELSPEEERVSHFLCALQEMNKPPVRQHWEVDVTQLEGDVQTLARAMKDLMVNHIKEQRTSWLEISGIGMEGPVAQATQTPKFLFTEIPVGEHGLVRLPRAKWQGPLFSIRENSMPSFLEGLREALRQQISDVFDQAPRDIFMQAAGDCLLYNRRKGLVGGSGNKDWLISGWAGDAAGKDLEFLAANEPRPELCRAFRKVQTRRPRRGQEAINENSIIERTRLISDALKSETLKDTCQYMVQCFLEDVLSHWVPVRIYCGKYMDDPNLDIKGDVKPINIAMEVSERVRSSGQIEEIERSELAQSVIKRRAGF